MKPIHILASIFLFCLLSACGDKQLPKETASAAHMETPSTDFPRGPNNGRLLEDGEFAVEVAIFETGVPPEFHVWAYQNDISVAPADVDLSITLSRLDGQDEIEFSPQGEFLKGNSVVYEPHSFAVAVAARYQGQQYQWSYESFEGRTTIAPVMADAFGIKTAIAGPAKLEQRLKVLGKITANKEYTRNISARFNGLVKNVEASLGEQVQAGKPLLTIESNESLKPYTITSPIDGVISGRFINPGEQSSGQILIEVMDTSQVWAELSIFPSQRSQVQTGAQVLITSPVSGASYSGTIDSFTMTTNANQSLTALIKVDNKDNAFPPGTFVEGSIKIADFDVPLAVKREGLQAFRDFTVVYAKVGDTYEVRMLELGRQDEEWIEVLGGLEPGTVYVTSNSYILKADVEKSGASHDH